MGKLRYTGVSWSRCWHDGSDTDFDEGTPTNSGLFVRVIRKAHAKPFDRERAVVHRDAIIFDF